MNSFYLTPVWLGLVLGNIAHQALASQDWHQAIDRSFFQAVALLAVAITNKIRR